MPDGRGMSLSQTFSQVLQVTQQLPQFGPFPMYLVEERNAFHEFHRDEVRAFVLSDLENLCDVGMAQCSRRLGFTNKPIHAIAIRRDVARKYLQRYFAIESCVARQIHLSHSARSDFRDDAVV